MIEQQAIIEAIDPHKAAAELSSFLTNRSMKFSHFKKAGKCRYCDGSGKSGEIDHAAVGAWVRGYRLRASVSLRELGRKCGWSASYLSDMELGRRNWSEDKFKKVLAMVD